MIVISKLSKTLTCRGTAESGKKSLLLWWACQALCHLDLCGVPFNLRRLLLWSASLSALLSIKAATQRLAWIELTLSTVCSTSLYVFLSTNHSDLFSSLLCWAQALKWIFLSIHMKAVSQKFYFNAFTLMGESGLRRRMQSVCSTLPWRILQARALWEK